MVSEPKTKNEKRKTGTRLFCYLLPAACCLFSLSGCHLDMWQQTKAKPLDQSNFFKDGQASRPLVANTVARGQLRLDEHLYTGKVKGQLVDTFPFPITKEDLARGQERFNVYCSPCHGRLGNGQGFIVLRGQWKKKPADLHQKRLRDLPVGHFYDVITNGFGMMYSYASRIPVEDRWRIVAYVRALQYSQQATMADVPLETLQKLIQNPNETILEEGASHESTTQPQH